MNNPRLVRRGGSAQKNDRRKYPITLPVPLPTWQIMDLP
jgi:hypothetical protein